MKVTNKVKSYNYKTETDCFENSGPPVTDHVYPLSLGGSDIKQNKIKLTKQSNQEKADKTKGTIGENWRFSVAKKETKTGHIYGTMYIRKQNWKKEDGWWEVLPTE